MVNATTHLSPAYMRWGKLPAGTVLRAYFSLTEYTITGWDEKTKEHSVVDAEGQTRYIDTKCMRAYGILSVPEEVVDGR